MSHCPFEVVYDIRSLVNMAPGPEWLALPLSGAGLYAVYRWPTLWVRLGLIHAKVVIAILFCMSIVGVAFQEWKRIDHAMRLSNGRVFSVEGDILLEEEFACKGEKLLIGGRLFEYSDYQSGAGFRIPG